ncbi:MAG: DUF4288 domain-containing protein [Gemmataceae bacterium]|nr:DUF4288 domain-containing protein [Gemmataceae bacterium]
MNRYAAKLLFQFRVTAGGKDNRRRLCEEQIVLIAARSAREALAAAKRRGREGVHRYRNGAGGLVRFEFVGVMELLHLGLQCAPDEVWYDITRRVRPKERADRFIPPEAALHAFRNEFGPATSTQVRPDG